MSVPSGLHKEFKLLVKSSALLPKEKSALLRYAAGCSEAFEEVPGMMHSLFGDNRVSCELIAKLCEIKKYFSNEQFILRMRKISEEGSLIARPGDFMKTVEFLKGDDNSDLIAGDGSFRDRRNNNQLMYGVIALWIKYDYLKKRDKHNRLITETDKVLCLFDLFGMDAKKLTEYWRNKDVMEKKAGLRFVIFLQLERNKINQK